MRRVLFLVLPALLPGRLAAQGVTAGAAYWLKSPHVIEYKLGVGGFRAGAFSLAYSAQYLDQKGASKAHWYGVGADMILRTTPDAAPYLVGGAAVGAGRGPTGGGEAPGVGFWGGVGAEVFTVGSVGLQAEALYSWRSKVAFRSLSLGLKIGSRLGRPTPLEAAGPAAIPGANPADEEALRLATAAREARAPAAEIVATALGAMGTPYRWGGTGADGFDCSGLIQFAYAQHGITLPRRSVEQARSGAELARNLEAVLPGDILTFAAEPGGPVSHVGLYVGEGRFIHSARGGVQVSALSAADPVGRWWWERWVGARRIL